MGNKNFDTYGENFLCSFLTPFSLTLSAYGLDCIMKLLEDCLSWFNAGNRKHSRHFRPRTYSRSNTRNSVPKSVEGQLKRKSWRGLPLDCWFPGLTVCACSVSCNCFVTPWPVACQAPLSMGFSISSSSRSSLLKDQTQVSCVFCIAGRVHTAEPLGKPSHTTLSKIQRSESCCCCCLWYSTHLSEP